MTAATAIRLTPLPGEALNSAVRRLAITQGYDEEHTFGLYKTSDRDPDERGLARYSDVLGVPVERLVKNTLQQLPSPVPWVASRRMQRKQPIRCECGLTSYWSYLVLVTVCVFCERPLSGERPSAAAAVAQDDLLIHLKTTDPLPRRFVDLRRLIEVAHPEPDMPAFRDPESWRRWGSPETITEFLDRAWPATLTRELADAQLYRLVLGVLGISVPAHPRFDSIERETWKLDQIVLRERILPADLPNCLPLSGYDLTRTSLELRLGHAAAVALARRLRSHHPGREHAVPDVTARSSSAPYAAPWVAWFTNEPAGIAALRQVTLSLLDGRPQNLDRARTLLRPLDRLPQGVVDRLSGRGTQNARSLAAAYVWLDQTRGSLRTSAFDHRADEVMDFVDKLTPEDRLTLRAYGDRHLRLNDELAAAEWNLYTRALAAS